MKLSDINKSLLIGIGLICARFIPIFLGKTIIFGDNFSLMVPGKLFTAQWLSQGIMPLWNPLLFAGIPWIGDINQSVLYPSTLFFMVLSPAAALNLTVLSHQILTFIGMYFLTRRFVKQQWLMVAAALVWTFSPQLTGTINNISTLQSLSWMPWVVLAGLSVGTRWRYSLLFSLATLAQFAGGYPQHVLYSILTAVLLSAWTQRAQLKNMRSLGVWFGKWAVTGALVVLITAAYWLPFLETLQGSTRTIQTETQAASGSLVPIELGKIVFPYVFDNPLAGMKWGPLWNEQPNLMLYLTWTGLLIFCAWVFTQRKKKTADDWFFLSVCAVCVILAMGENLPFYSVVQQLPVLKDMRGVSIILMIPALLLPLWLAMKADTLSLSKKTLSRTCVVFASLALVATLLYLVQVVSFSAGWTYVDEVLKHKLSASSFHTLERDKVIASSFLAFLAVTSTITSLVIWTYMRKNYWLVVILLAIEMAILTQGHFRYGPVSVYDLPDPSKSVAQLLTTADLTNYRTLTRNYNAPYSDFGAYYDAMIVRAPFSDSYIDEAELTTFAHLTRMRDGATPDWNTAMNIPVIHGYTTLLPLSIHKAFVAEAGAEASINDLPVILTTSEALKKWATRYYIVDRWFPNYEEVFPENVLAENESWTVYEVPNALSRFRYGDETDIELQNFSETPNEISFATQQIPGKTEIIIADRYDKNWQVSVNDVEVPLENYEGMRRFTLPAPESDISVKLWYEPASFYRGLALSLTTLFVVIVWLSFDFLRSRRSSS